MKQVLISLLVGILIAVAGYGLYVSYNASQTQSDTANTEQQTFDTETKEMILFMHPDSTEESVEAYLEDIQQLNKTYGYTSGGTPKGDIETMRSYAAAIEQLQVKHKIVSEPDTATAPSRVDVQTVPLLAPKQADPLYVPPTGSSSAPASSPPLIKGGKSVSMPAAPIMPTTELGQNASTPPLIQQDNIPPAPPVPPQMSSE